MDKLIEHRDYCPYCGETISLLIDCSTDHQNYIEDCEVCCRPIVVAASINHSAELLTVSLHSETDII